MNDKDKKCSHKGCINFKTSKQRLVHHDKLDVECINEKMMLIKLAGTFQETIKYFVNKYEININPCDIVAIKNEINSVKLTNSEYYDSLIDRNNVL